MVLLVRSAVPLVQMPPPSPIAVFPLTVLLVKVRVPAFQMPPPPLPSPLVLPWRIVTPEISTSPSGMLKTREVASAEEVAA